jgi:CBS domain-containing protein
MLIGIAATLTATVSMGPDVMQLFREDPERALSMLSAGETILLWLGPVNVVLALFNMVPGFPLDGGRVFRALAWWATGDLEKATRWASGAGKMFAIALMGAGVLMALGFQLPWFGRGLGPGLWLLLIGWFLFKAAQVSYQQLLIREAIEGVHVNALMRHRFQAVPPSCDLQTLVRNYAMQSEQDSFPVVERGRLLGMVRIRDAMRVSHDRWATTRVEQVMSPAADVDAVKPQAEVGDALRSLQQKQLTELPVVEDGYLCGLLEMTDIFRWVALHQLEHDGSRT